MRRFFTDEIDEANLRATIRGGEFHHLVHVLRQKKGDRFNVFDGRGREFAAILEEVGSGIAIAKIVDRIEDDYVEPCLDLVLAQGITREEKMGIIIQKATELGVSTIIPLKTERAIPRINEFKARTKRERWQRIATEATKQCRRKMIPDVKPPIPLSEFCKEPFDGLKLILWEEEGECRLSDVVKKGSRAIVITIGPEGGFSLNEIDDARRNGFISVTLGRRILRTETASIAALSILLHISGDLG